jgi:hypothetical protein
MGGVAGWENLYIGLAGSDKGGLEYGVLNILF